MYNNFLNCKYPIVAAPMNRVSNLNLAVACQKAGILPSLSLYSYITRELKSVDFNWFEKDLKRYQDLTGTNNILVSAGNIDLNREILKKILFENKITFVEVIHHDVEHIPLEHRKTANELMLKEIVASYTAENIKIIPKLLKKIDFTCSVSDGIMLKGSEGAGRIDPRINFIEEIADIKKCYPNLHIIFSGGIGTSTDVKTYLNLGCTAVGIGTLLTVAQETSISKETKEKIIAASSSDISTLSDGANQNALVFKKLDNDDFNHSNALIHGIKDPSSGLIFAGKSINNNKKIRPVNDIIQELIEGVL